MQKFSGLTVQNSHGDEIAMQTFDDKVLLIVNTASKCGFTPQYEGLEALHQKYADQGLVVLGFPCNQFGQQEPGDDASIQSFCSLNYSVTFPVMKKIEVNGSAASPLYKYLKAQAPGLFGTKAIKWNFTKFLVNKDGEVIKRYSPNTEPKDIAQDIENLL